jgi:hypothetical protein
MGRHYILGKKQVVLNVDLESLMGSQTAASGSSTLRHVELFYNGSGPCWNQGANAGPASVHAGLAHWLAMRMHDCRSVHDHPVIVQGMIHNVDGD